MMVNLNDVTFSADVLDGQNNEKCVKSDEPGPDLN
jgi:hypothetical protein